MNKQLLAGLIRGQGPGVSAAVGVWVTLVLSGADAHMSGKVLVATLISAYATAMGWRTAEGAYDGRRNEKGVTIPSDVTPTP